MMIFLALVVVAFVAFVLGVEFGRSDTGRRLGYSRRAKTAPYVVQVDDHEAAIAAYIAAHDPAWVLADIDSKRRILDLHDKAAELVVAASGTLVGSAADVALGAYEKVLQSLAALFSGHPDFRTEWNA